MGAKLETVDDEDRDELDFDDSDDDTDEQDDIDWFEFVVAISELGCALVGALVPASTRGSSLAGSPTSSFRLGERPSEVRLLLLHDTEAATAAAATAC